MTVKLSACVPYRYTIRSSSDVVYNNLYTLLYLYIFIIFIHCSNCITGAQHQQTALVNNGYARRKRGV